MKKFICTSPRQSVYPLNYNVVRNSIEVDTNSIPTTPPYYEPVDCEHLRYEVPCGFPVIPLINAYVEPGEEFEVLVLTEDLFEVPADDPFSGIGSHINFELIKYDVKKICQEKNAKAVVKKLMIPIDERIDAIISTFERLIAELKEGDCVYADITYGSRVGCMYAPLLALAYAHKALNNCYVECIVYGEAIFKQGKVVRRNIHDETKLFLLDQIMTNMALQNIEHPAEMLRSILHLGTDEEEPQ